MRYVLDSSVAVKWLLAEVDSDKALRLRDDYRNGVHELLAPDVLPVECTHSLTRAERQGRITPTEGAKHFTDLMRTLPILHPHLVLLPRAYAISSSARIGVYDCLYVALAEREGCQLVTADARLVGNLQRQFPFLVALSSLP
jgi:predicted nucleic acid-binding protein